MNKITSNRVITPCELQGVCKRHNFYTCGSNEEFGAMLERVSHTANVTDDLLYEIAQDIKDHSDTDFSVGWIMTTINEAAVTLYDVSPEDSQ